MNEQQLVMGKLEEVPQKEKNDIMCNTKDLEIAKLCQPNHKNHNDEMNKKSIIDAMSQVWGNKNSK